jgi:DNA mismatch endonuclease (patch repair protein)
MSQIRSKNTVPELAVRQLLYAAGFRYRLHDSGLPGKPDLSNKKRKIAVFVHGCFWHQHEGCKRANIPKSNTDYWIPKLKSNVKRFENNVEKLGKMGFRTIVIWECEIKNLEKNNKLMEIANVNR